MPRTPRSKPEGLTFTAHASIRGFARWQVLDERGVPEVPRSPSGFALAPVEGVRQPNLILNRGLDALPLYESMEANPVHTSWREYLAVGTGSGAPSVGQEQLGNEVARSDTKVTNGSNSYSLDTDANVFRAVIRRDLVCTLSSSANLTEYGFTHQPVQFVFNPQTEEDEPVYGDLHIRELLRDEFGTPVSISLVGGKKLRVVHDLIAEIDAPEAGEALSFDIVEYDAANQFVATHAYDYTGGFAANAESVFKVWNPFPRSMAGSPTNAPYVFLWLQGNVYSRTTLSTNRAGGTEGGRATYLAYVGGTYERTVRRIIAATETAYNVTAAGVLFALGVNGGYSAVFTNPTTFVNAETHDLEVRLTSSWARAT